MRFTALAIKIFGLFAIYAIICGAFKFSGTQGGTAHFLSQLLAPFEKLTLLEGSILAAASFLLVSGMVIGAASTKDGGTLGGSIWPPLLLGAFVVNSIVLVGLVSTILIHDRSLSNPAEIGSIYGACICEAFLGAILASMLFFMRRPRFLFVPAVGILCLGITALGALFWLGQGGLH